MILIATTMPMTSLMTVTLIAELAALCYARSVHVNYVPVHVAAAAPAPAPPPAAATAKVVPVGLAIPLYDNDASLGSAPEQTAESATSRVPSSHSKRLQHNALDDPSNYDYSYGDPNYDYNTNERRPTEEKDNLLPTLSTPQLLDVTARPIEERGNSLPTSGTLQLGGGDDTVYTTTPESDNPDDDDDDVVADGTGFFDAFHWLHSQWIKAKVNIQQQVEQQLQEMKKSVTEFIYKFGELVEEGAEYCVHKLRQAAREVNSQGAVVLQKLRQSLQDGNKEVAALFRLIGLKVREWSRRRQHQDETGGAEDVTEEEGDVVTGKSGVEGMVPDYMVSQYQRGGSLWNKTSEDAHPQRTVGHLPNLFLDPSVMQKIDQLVKAGILTREDIQAVLGAL